MLKVRERERDERAHTLMELDGGGKAPEVLSAAKDDGGNGGTGK